MSSVLDDPKVRAHIAALVADAPPLTDEQRARLRSLLRVDRPARRAA